MREAAASDGGSAAGSDRGNHGGFVPPRFLALDYASSPHELFYVNYNQQAVETSVSYTYHRKITPRDAVRLFRI